jgi:hypothetical protein
MVIPVTTKPFLHRFNFILLPQGVPAFFLFIKKISNNILLPAKTGFTDMNRIAGLGAHALRFAGLINLPTSLNHIMEIGVSQIKEDFSNGKSSGI